MILLIPTIPSLLLCLLLFTLSLTIVNILCSHHLPVTISRLAAIYHLVPEASALILAGMTSSLIEIFIGWITCILSLAFPSSLYYNIGVSCVLSSVIIILLAVIGGMCMATGVHRRQASLIDASVFIREGVVICILMTVIGVLVLCHVPSTYMGVIIGIYWIYAIFLPRLHTSVRLVFDRWSPEEELQFTSFAGVYETGEVFEESSTVNKNKGVSMSVHASPALTGLSSVTDVSSHPQRSSSQPRSLSDAEDDHGNRRAKNRLTGEVRVTVEAPLLQRGWSVDTEDDEGFNHSLLKNDDFYFTDEKKLTHSVEEDGLLDWDSTEGPSWTAEVTDDDNEYLTTKFLNGQSTSQSMSQSISQSQSTSQSISQSTSQSTSQTHASENENVPILFAPIATSTPIHSTASIPNNGTTQSSTQNHPSSTHPSSTHPSSTHPSSSTRSSSNELVNMLDYSLINIIADYILQCVPAYHPSIIASTRSPSSIHHPSSITHHPSSTQSASTQSSTTHHPSPTHSASTIDPPLKCIVKPISLIISFMITNPEQITSKLQLHLTLFLLIGLLFLSLLLFTLTTVIVAEWISIVYWDMGLILGFIINIHRFLYSVWCSRDGKLNKQICLLYASLMPMIIIGVLLPAIVSSFLSNNTSGGGGGGSSGGNGGNGSKSEEYGLSSSVIHGSGCLIIALIVLCQVGYLRCFGRMEGSRSFGAVCWLALGGFLCLVVLI